MTSRERLLAVLHDRLPDCVPCCPDISNMVPCRLTGKPFGDIYVHQDPPLWKAYIDAVTHQMARIAALDVKPDFLLCGGSGSLVWQSPDTFRDLALPVLRGNLHTTEAMLRGTPAEVAAAARKAMADTERQRSTETMTKRERIRAQLAGQPVDRVPRVGGWILGAANLAALAGITTDDYLADPAGGVAQALAKLDVDAVAGPIIPREAGQIRDGKLEEYDFRDVTPEKLQEDADALPDTEADVVAGVDLDATYAEYSQSIRGTRALIGDAEIMPMFWAADAGFSLYFQYGYEAFLAATALYPEAVAKIYWADGIATRERNRALLRCYREFDLPPILFCGDDICTAQRPMVSPVWLREHYWPHSKTALQPLVDAGIRLIHHCDGNVTPLLDDMIEAGFTGFQGFQYEFGVDPFVMREKLAARGVRPLFLGGLSVTQTLPFGTDGDVRAEIDYAFDFSAGGRDLFLFTSNVTGVEVPPERIREAYAYAATRPVASADAPEPAPRPWPWGLKHPDGYFGL